MMAKKAVVFVVILIVLVGLLGLGSLFQYGGPSEEPSSRTGTPTFGEKESLALARNWIRTSAPTYVFDGLDLSYQDVRQLDCETCFEFTFTFQSRQAGFGNRTDSILAQVITPHTIVVTVEKGAVKEALTDEVFDEISEELLIPAGEGPAGVRNGF